MRFPRSALAATALLSGLLAAAWYRSQAIGAPTATEPLPHVLLAFTEPNAEATAIVEAGRTWAMVPHLADGTVKGAVLPDHRSAVVIAETVPTRDRSWNSTLSVVKSDGQIRALVDRVYAGTRPFVTADGKVLVTRGVAGVEPEPQKGFQQPLRIDAQTIEAVDPVSGESRVLWRGAGYLAFIAAVSDRDAFFYDVGPSASALRAIELRTGSVRTLASDLGIARDFTLSADQRALVFTQHARGTTDEWQVVKFPLGGGAPQVLAARPFMALFPVSLKSGVAFNEGQVRGLSVLTDTDASKRIDCPFGDGADQVLAASKDGAWMAGVHTEPGAFGRPFVLDARTSVMLPISVPASVRSDVLGVWP